MRYSPGAMAPSRSTRRRASSISGTEVIQRGFPFRSRLKMSKFLSIEASEKLSRFLQGTHTAGHSDGHAVVCLIPQYQGVRSDIHGSIEEISACIRRIGSTGLAPSNWRRFG